MPNKIVSQADWLAARKALLAKEKAFSLQRDELARERQSLPWVKVEKDYVFEAPEGKRTLAQLFGAKSQLIVYHFMLGPGWEAGCKSCSYLADHFEGALPHLAARDVSFVAVSRAPLAEIEVFRKRMGWRFPWVSSHGNDFNFDFHVSFRKEDIGKRKVEYNYELGDARMEELPGASAFCKDAQGGVFHTYSTYARGLDMMIGAYNWLDIAPRGRDEDKLEFTMSWVRHHDNYEKN
ncbi:MAG TPA: thioredoxin family protein [Burkholderiales bacterium]|nr:thioredoxin family protein [Burkholderiales bacterium]